MSVVDLHPEDLLDKALLGDLSADEQARLDTHLARCEACRAERVLRFDFASELDGEDRPSALFGLVQEALQSADNPSKPEVIAPPRRRSRLTAVMLIAAAAVLAVSAAGATSLLQKHWLSLATRTTPAESATRGRAHESTSVQASRSHAAELMPEAPATPVVTDEVIAQPVPAPPVTVSTPVRHAVRDASAASMFEAANAARRAGAATRAIALYDELALRFPASREARSARATAARLLLDQGDAQGAARRFESYLASGSVELREEAMAGRATAFERLGRNDDEARAWTSLLEAYPQTPYAAHAHARLVHLANGAPAR